MKNTSLVDREGTQLTSSQLVGFVAHPNPQIRQVAVENLVPYSTAEPSIFKTEELKPVKNVAILIRDHPVSPLPWPSTCMSLLNADPSCRKSQNMLSIS